MNEQARELLLERELFVRSVMPTLHGEAAARLAAVLEPCDLPADSYMFRAGEPPEQFFFVVDGKVSMELEGQRPWTFGPRSLVGMLDLTLWRPHRRSCRSTAPTRLLVGRSKIWRDMMEDDALLASSAIQALGYLLYTQWQSHGHLLPPEPVRITPSFRLPLELQDKVLILRDTALFHRAGTQALASLALVAEELEVSAGAEVFPAHHADRTLYVVAHGLVELSPAVSGSAPGGADSRPQQGATRAGPLSVLGAAAALSGKLGDHSARALSDSVLLRVRDEDYHDQAEEHPQLTRAALAYLSAERERLMELAPPEA